MAKAIFLCLLGQQRQLTIHWGKDHGKEMVTVGDDILRKVKGNPKINTGHNFFKASMEAWAELARRRKAWEGESGSAELVRERR
eukprot:15474668-Alexandrium_andersonii.AAC.1